MINDYVTATYEALKEREPDAVLFELRSVLAARNHTSLYPQILRALLERMEQEAESARPVVTVATEADAHDPAVRADLATLGAAADPRIVIDPTLIGGAVVSYQNRTIDTSYKAALKKIYQTLITQ